ncbi:MAG: arsenate reductase ArsC [Pseudomonadota bacterium]
MNFQDLCTGNLVRPIPLESRLTHRSNGCVKAYSAGSKSSGKVHPQPFVFLAKEGFPIKGFSSQVWYVSAEPDALMMDAVIAVFGSAAGEECAMWQGAPVRAHWGVEDPATAAEPEREEAFKLAYIRFGKRAEALPGLPIDSMSATELQTTLNKIGTES